MSYEMLGKILQTTGEYTLEEVEKEREKEETENTENKKAGE